MKIICILLLLNCSCFAQPLKIVHKEEHDNQSMYTLSSSEIGQYSHGNFYENEPPPRVDWSQSRTKRTNLHPDMNVLDSQSRYTLSVNGRELNEHVCQSMKWEVHVVRERDGT